MKLNKLTTISALLFVLMSVSVFAAYWQQNPSTCPTSYQSQNCPSTPTQLRMCGYSGGIVYCYDTTTLSAPGSTANSVTQHTGSYGGGYVVDCEGYNAPSPFCDNGGGYWCNRDSSCFNAPTNKQTVCSASSWGSFTCGSCIAGYYNCANDGDPNTCEVQAGSTNCLVGSNNNVNSTCGCVCDSNYYDCDASGTGAGNGCEIQNGGSCSVGGIPGTYSCSTGGGSCTNGLATYSCNCVIAPQHHQTNIPANGSSGLPNLWSVQYGSGWLMNLTGDVKKTTLGVNNDGCVVFNDSSTQCSAPGAMGFVSGLGSAGRVAFWNSSSSLDSYENFTWDAPNKRLGVGTDAPLAALHIRYNQSAMPGSAAGLILTNYAPVSTGQAEILLDPAGSASNWTLSANDETIKFRIFENANMRFVIDSQGQVGIGLPTFSSVPYAKLNVENSGSGDSFRVDDQTSDTTPFVIDALGKVGIGTTSPNATLHVAGKINVTAGNDICIDGGKCLSATGAESGWNDTGSDVILSTTADNVGIGTTNPGAKLDVNGTIQHTLGIVSTGTGQAGSVAGNARGTGAVDIQTYRDASTQVASGNYAVIGGGYKNTASGIYSAVGGGDSNNANSGSATIAGGQSNSAGSVGKGAMTIGGGYSNTATGGGATVSGGTYNTASGDLSTVPGGNNNIASGNYSTAMGRNTAASGEHSTAMTYYTIANGSRSVAMGDQSVASGTISLATGYSTKAYGSYSTSMGQESVSRGMYSTAMGYRTNAEGTMSTATGRETNASGGLSFAMGYMTNASGSDSLSTGEQTSAQGDASFTAGVFTTARPYASVAVGRYNVISATSMTNWIDTDPVFIIGIGSDASNRANAMTVLKNGNIGIGTATPNANAKLDVNGNIYYSGNLTGYGADFAEFMSAGEKLDSGDVVCMDENKHVLRCSERAEKSVVGVVSEFPTIIGNRKSEVGVPVGITGIVKTKAKGPIARFDLLTTSDIDGHAEKATVSDFGAILGKALDPCDVDVCMIEVLVGGMS